MFNVNILQHQSLFNKTLPNALTYVNTALFTL